MATQSSWSASDIGSVSRPVSTASQRRRTSAPTSSPTTRRGPGPRRTCGPGRAAPTGPRGRSWSCRRPARGPGAGSGRRRPGAGRAPGGRSAGPGRGRRPRSWTARCAVVPTLRKVATSDRLASPTITWRRRYFWASAWGSSRVLTIGRFSVVSRPTSSSKKSARWLSWNGTSAVVRPGGLGADLAGAGEDLAGDEVRRDVADDAAERHRPVHQVVLVAAVASCPCRRSCSCRRRSPGPAAGAGAAASIERCRMHLGGPVEDARSTRASAHSGVEQLGVGVVDVVAGAVGEHGVDEVGLDLGRPSCPRAAGRGRRCRATRPRSPSRPARRLAGSVPASSLT